MNKLSPLMISLCFLAIGVARAGDGTDEPAWDEFGVAMSQDEHTRETGTARFGKGADSLRLTPSPVQVSGVQHPVQDLDGIWYFRSYPPEDFSTLTEAQVADWDRIEVPGDFRMQGFGGAKVGYVRFLNVPTDWKGNRMKLRCDEIASDATIWVNGQMVGKHIGHFIAFELDITNAVRFGERNMLAIQVKSDSIARRVSGYALHVGGGITRSIRVFAVPEVNMSRMHVTTDLDEDYRDAMMQLQVRIENESATQSKPISLLAELLDSEGHATKLEHSQFRLEPIKAADSSSWDVKIPVSAPKKWDAEHPNLYRLQVSLLEGDTVRETVERRIGFREIEVHGTQLLVNGKPVLLRGSCRHVAHPQRARSSTPQLDRLDAELFKKANCNFIRTSHYPPSESFIDACDELGLYVEEEAPFCFFSYPTNNQQLRAEDVKRYCCYANLKMVERDMSHPCVLIWSIANESHWGPHFEAAARAVSQYDPSRPRTFMWLPDGNTDILNIAASHYPSPNDVIKSDPTRPKVFSEYCHLPAYAPFEMYTDPGVENQWGCTLKLTWDNLYHANAALGASVWCGIDDDFHLPPVEGETDYQFRGTADWGVLDGWRRPKPEYWDMRKVYSPVRIDVSEVEVNEEGDAISIPVENRYDFTNLDELTIVWLTEEHRGAIQADIDPRSEGVLRIDDAKALACNDLRLQVIDSTGCVIDDYILSIDNRIAGVHQNDDVSKKSNVSLDAWQLERGPECMHLRRGNVSVRINRTSGMIIDARVDGTQVLCGGPIWSYLPTFSKQQQRTMKDKTPQLTVPYGTNWKCESVTTHNSENEIHVQVQGSYDEASLTILYRFLPDGVLTIDYDTTLHRGVIKPDDTCFIGRDQAKSDAGDFAAFVCFSDDGNAQLRRRQPNAELLTVEADRIAAVPRQMGMRLQLPADLDTLKWDRDAEWSIYPEDHIGRPHGTAMAFANGLDTRELPGQKPLWPWSMSANELGTRDFRSTKHNIRQTSLSGGEGYGVEVMSDATQHSRCYVQGDRIDWIIADIDNGPSEAFMSGYYQQRRKPFPLETPIHGSIKCRFLCQTK